jgi:hypothetical protein
MSISDARIYRNVLRNSNSQNFMNLINIIIELAVMILNGLIQSTACIRSHCEHLAIPVLCELEQILYSTIIEDADSMHRF